MTSDPNALTEAIRTIWDKQLRFQQPIGVAAPSPANTCSVRAPTTCGAPATVLFGCEVECECPRPATFGTCDAHAPMVLASAWCCAMCHAPAKISEPVSL